MSKRKKTSTAPSTPNVPVETSEAQQPPDVESVTTRATVPPELMKQAIGDSEEAGDADGVEDSGVPETDQEGAERMAESVDVPIHHDDFDAELTVNLSGEMPLPGRDDLDEPTVTAPSETLEDIDRLLLQRKHLRGLLEALVFASDSPIKPNELAKLASAPVKQVKELLAELKSDFSTRGIHLDEVAGGWVFRTSPQYAPFVRDLTKQKPVRLTRAQVETLAIIAYRQPITRPEIDDVRGVDSGPVLKLLLERDLVRILGKRDEPGRPLIYGTTSNFLEFFGLKSLKDLPTLREFTELSDESREAFEDELGETPEDAARRAATDAAASAGAEHDAAGAAPLPEDEGTHADKGEGELDSAAGDHDHEGRSVHESMSVPIGEQPLDDLGEDDLEPISIEDQDGEAPRHASDEDGPTLTSEAPSGEDE